MIGYSFNVAFKTLLRWAHFMRQIGGLSSDNDRTDETLRKRENAARERGGDNDVLLLGLILLQRTQQRRLTMPRRTDTARANVTAASTAGDAADRATEMTGSLIKVGRGAEAAEGSRRRRRRAESQHVPAGLMKMVTTAAMNITGTMHRERRRRLPLRAGASARARGALGATRCRMFMRAGIKPANACRRRGRTGGKRRLSRALLACDTAAGARIERGMVTAGRLTGTLTLHVLITLSFSWKGGNREYTTFAICGPRGLRSPADLQLEVMRRGAPPEARPQRCDPSSLAIKSTTIV